MKLIVSSAAIAVILAVASGAFVARADPQHDVNRDGAVDIVDAVVVLNHFGETFPGDQLGSTIAGRVVKIESCSQTGCNVSPIVGALVGAQGALDLYGEPVTAFTGPDGYFLLDRVPRGLWTISVSYEAAIPWASGCSNFGVVPNIWSSGDSADAVPLGSVTANNLSRCDSVNTP